MGLEQRILLLCKMDGVVKNKTLKRKKTCGRWSSVSESLPAYGAISSAVGRGDGTPLNLGELRIPEMDFRLPPKNPTTLVVRSVNETKPANSATFLAAVWRIIHTLQAKNKRQSLLISINPLFPSFETRRQGIKKS
jgi:hypothetical protein